MSRMEQEVFRIFNRETGSLEGAYSRACHTEYDFGSVSEARNSNVHGIYKDRTKYKVAKYRVIYELIQDECDAPTEEERAQANLKALQEALDAELYKLTPEEEEQCKDDPIKRVMLPHAKKLAARIDKAIMDAALGLPSLPHRSA